MVSTQTLNTTQLASASIKETVIEARQHLVYTLDASVDSYVNTYRFVCQKESSLELNIILSESIHRSLCIEVVLNESGARANIIGCLALSQNAKFQVRLLQVHSASYTISSSMFKSVLSDYAFLDYQGNIVISEAAVGADAQLYNKNMLLSEHARVQSVPSLEVLTNEVHCKHGTATSAFNKEQLLYMQSRGIDIATTQQLLLKAFFTPELSDKHEELQHLINTIQI